jgi:hypothetical protein
MNNLLAACLIILTFCLTTFAKFDIAPLEERVSKSNLIVFGYLGSVETYSEGNYEISEGFITVTNHISGKVKPVKNTPFIKIKWRNSKLFACTFSPVKEEVGIWLLKSDQDGSINEISPGTFVSLKELREIEKILGQKISIEPIRTLDFSEPLEDSFIELENSKLITKKTPLKSVADLELNTKSDSIPNALLRGLLVLIIALILYRLLYRVRFKVKVKRKKNNGRSKK